MKLLVCFLYCLFTIAYAWYPFETTKWVYLFGMLNLLAFISVLCYFLNKNTRNTENESIFLQYAMWLTICRGIYTVICVFNDKVWILHNTNVFNVLTAISFGVILIHCSLKRS